MTAWEQSGVRERSRRATEAAIEAADVTLIGTHGFDAVTGADIAACGDHGTNILPVLPVEGRRRCCS